MTRTVLEQLDTYGPSHCEALTPEQAVAYTRELTESQYENFTVASWFLPAGLREDFYAVYSFCRWADDLGDETGDTAYSLELLAWWSGELEACYAGKPRHPVFVALAPVIAKHDIPIKPFADLIAAFVQDQTVTRYESWDQVLDYCTGSANPVGRLVLYLSGYRDENRQQLSDATCTALQLTNFWQDVRRDVIERDRVYIPRKIAFEHDLNIDDMVSVIKTDHQLRKTMGDCCGSGSCLTGGGVEAILPAYRQTIYTLVTKTWPLFGQGRQLWPLVKPDVRTDLKLFILGGEAILKRIEKQRFNTLESRPTLTKTAKLGLMMRAVFAKLVAPLTR